MHLSDNDWKTIDAALALAAAYVREDTPDARIIREFERLGERVGRFNATRAARRAREPHALR
jgi:hypothetical protein